MNSRLIAGLALCFTAVTLAAEPPVGDEAKLPDQPKDYATVVLPKLDTIHGWIQQIRCQVRNPLLATVRYPQE